MSRVGIGVVLLSFLASDAFLTSGGVDPRRDQPGGSQVSPADVGLDPKKLERIDAAIKESIDKNELPGAVVLIVRQGQVAYRQAFGLRAKQPAEAPMTADTVFDVASLTKPIATATSIMILLEQGKLALTDPVSRHLPEFGQNGKDKIIIEQLLLHTSGLIADNPIKDYEDGRTKAFERIYQLKPVAEPESKFIYSDVNFIVLGQLVEKLSGEPLDIFARKNIFEPLGMKETGFRPNEELKKRAAPTEQREGRWMQGEVHDPRAYLLGGVAGHAGLFSTGDDLAIYAQMLLNKGDYQGRRILSPATVRLMTTPRPVPGGFRALGWDVQTGFSRNRGELFPFGSFGHTGFTGTSLWIDPSSQTAVIFLSNRLHPDGKGNVTPLRGRVATLAAAAIVKPPFPRPLDLPPLAAEPRASASGAGAARSLTVAVPQVLTGVDVLKRDGFRQLKGRRVGLVTNHTGVDRDGNSIIDLLHKAESVTLVALFSPEHGIRGLVDKAVGDSKDEKTGLPVYSLYTEKRRRPTPEQLKDIDTLVFDIQDIGCRFYTYISTLGYILETAAEHKLKVVVLDRPNPIGGLAVEGPVLEKERESFTGYHPLPVRHGMSVGELARLFNSERKIDAELEVIAVQGWRRGDLFDRTGLMWINPSPNMRSLTAALLYPGIGLLETTNVSVGRGTDRPFEVIGAPWLDGRRLAEALAKAELPGVRFVPLRFTPASSTYAGKECGGVQIIVDNWERFQSLETGIEIARQLKLLHPGDWQSKNYIRLLAHQPTLEAIERGALRHEIVRVWQTDVEAFRRVRNKYLIYAP